MKGNTKKKKMTKRKRQKFKIIGLIFLILLLLILLGVAFVMSKWSRLDRITFGKRDLTFNELPTETEESMKGYKTLALFGLDNRSNGSFQSGNSDMIIVVSINQDTGEIKMASVYRDTYLDIGDGKFNKANAAYNRGGPKQAVNMLNKNLDLNITDYVSVDFNAVVDAVDAVDGIELEVTAEEAGYINGYIDEINELTKKNSSHVSAGKQTLDGVQATAYARIRYTAGSDFKRTERQRTVITKVFEKARTADLLTLNKIVDEMIEEVSTSLSLTEILGLAADAAKYSMGENIGFPYETKTMDIGSVTYAEVPVDFMEGVKELHQFLFENEEYQPSQTIEKLDSTLEGYTG